MGKKEIVDNKLAVGIIANNYSDNVYQIVKTVGRQLKDIDKHNWYKFFIYAIGFSNDETRILGNCLAKMNNLDHEIFTHPGKVRIPDLRKDLISKMKDFGHTLFIEDCNSFDKSAILSLINNENHPAFYDPNTYICRQDWIVNQRTHKNSWKSNHIDIPVKEKVSIKSPENEEDGLVAIIMSTWNRTAFTERCIESINQNTDYPYFLIVVDDCSDKESQESLKRMKSYGMIDHLIILKKHAGRLGKTALDTGIKWVKHNIKDKIDYVAIIDNDMEIYHPFWLRVCINAIDKFPLLHGYKIGGTTVLDENRQYHKTIKSFDFDDCKLDLKKDVGGGQYVYSKKLLLSEDMTYNKSDSDWGLFRRLNKLGYYFIHITEANKIKSESFIKHTGKNHRTWDKKTKSKKINTLPQKKVLVYTSITGGRDTLIDPSPLNPEHSYVLFTDDRNIKSETFSIIHLPKSQSKSEEIRYARKAKLQPHKFFPIDDYDYVIWIDGNCHFINGYDSITNDLKNDSIAIFGHSDRKCLYEEATECINLKLDNKDTIKNQISKYRTDGFKDQQGLWATHCLVYKPTPEVISFLNEWYEEIENGSLRDQISLPYVLNKTKIPFHTLLNTNYLSKKWATLIKKEPHNV